MSADVIRAVDALRRDCGVPVDPSVPGPWLLAARCRAAGYARMPVSLEPVVRAEDGLKPLFTPFPVLVNRLYRTAGLFRRGEA